LSYWSWRISPDEAPAGEQIASAAEATNATREMTRTWLTGRFYLVRGSEFKVFGRKKKGARSAGALPSWLLELLSGLPDQPRD
jgi:hypothetical protein